MKKLALIITFLALPLTSYAQDALYLSGMLGLTQIEQSNENTAALDPNYSTELSYGARFGLLFNDHVSAGLFLQMANGQANDVSGTTTDINTDMLNVMAEVTYYFSEADENSFWLSGLLGKTMVDTEVGNLTADESETSFGASVGYHFMVAPNFSLSPQATWIHTPGSSVTSNQLSGMVNLTLWL